MYIKAPDQYPYSLSMLRQDNPLTSFPDEIPDGLAAQFGVYTVTPAPMPSFDVRTQDVSEAAPQLVDGVWTQQWVVRELTPQEIDARTPVVVSMRQARLALLAAGLLDQVSTAMAGASTEAQIEWEYATEVRRDSPLVISMAGSLGLTDGQVRDLFWAASAL